MYSGCFLCTYIYEILRHGGFRFEGCFLVRACLFQSIFLSTSICIYFRLKSRISKANPVSRSERAHESIFLVTFSNSCIMMWSTPSGVLTGLFSQELRSRKRQTTGLACVDIPPVNSLPPDQVTSLESQVLSESGTWGMPACKTAVNYPSTDAVEERKDFSRESCADVSKRPFIREKYRRIKGNPCNRSTGKLGSLNMAPAKQELGITSEDNSDELFPEHNGNVVDNLQVLRGMNKTVLEPSPSPVMKAQKNSALVSSVEHGSEGLLHVVDPEASNKIYTKIEEDNIDLEQLEKMKENAAERGGTIDPGWKVQISDKQVNVRPNSMRSAVGHLKDRQIWKEEKPGTTEPNGVASCVSVCLNVSDSKKETIAGNLALDQVPHKMDKETNKLSLEVTTSVVAEHGPNKGCNSILWSSNETKEKPLHEPINLEREGRGTGSLQNFGDLQEELPSESSNLETEDRHIKSMPNLKEKQSQPWSGTSDLRIKDENMKNLSTHSSKDMRNSKHMNWTEVLEEILNSSCMTSGGIRNSISKALASGPPECAKKFLQESISKDASNNGGTLPMKEAVSSVLLAWYRGEQLGYRYEEREESPEENEIVPENTKMEKDAFINNCGRKMAAQEAVSSSDVVTKRCCDVFFKIISSEKFMLLCNLVRGSVTDSRVHEVFDFRHIDSRMNSGTYGKSPELFASDMQQLWKNVHKIGKEMVLLTDALSQLSQNFYEKEVAAVLQPGTAQSCKLDDTDKPTSGGTFLDQGDEAEEMCNQRRHKFGQFPRVGDIRNESITTSKILGDKDSVRVAEDRKVELNGTTKGFNLSPSGKIQIAINSQCLPCEKCDHPSSGTDGSLCKETMLIEEGKDAVVYHCVVCERLSKMQNFQVKQQAEPQSASKGDVANLQGEEVELSMEQINLHTNKTEMTEQASAEELQPCNEESIHGRLCRVCSVGEKDGDYLMDCSNTKCVSKFYHLSCLTPKLDTIPPPGWYCPSCLCRICFVDENDDFIILCDDCDEGYHIYCLNPPLDEIPEGKWYCLSCTRKQKRKRSKKCKGNGSNRLNRRVQPKKKSEMVDQFLSANVDVLKESHGGNVGNRLNKKSSSRVRLKKISSMVTHNVPNVISNRSHFATDKLCKGVKPKVGRKRKRIY
ncbi:uncharacterized protein LOC131061245 isoform X3 [Cryptomeria japonica]|uniref:uncharacterized protein LOC131061245 isoform X3 n=1 Tax=Cryptomeria japonica TaxID=3369 RepID=UPI0027DA34C8|nr:uncharacterized protein LOC131061245 isoform X3 [Cryptomeria japonica]